MALNNQIFSLCTKIECVTYYLMVAARNTNNSNDRQYKKRCETGTEESRAIPLVLTMSVSHSHRFGFDCHPLSPLTSILFKMAGRTDIISLRCLTCFNPILYELIFKHLFLRSFYKFDQTTFKPIVGFSIFSPVF